jgi:hypothetical protein
MGKLHNSLVVQFNMDSPSASSWLTQTVAWEFSGRDSSSFSVDGRLGYRILDFVGKFLEQDGGLGWCQNLSARLLCPQFVRTCNITESSIAVSSSGVNAFLDFINLGVLLIEFSSLGQVNVVKLLINDSRLSRLWLQQWALDSTFHVTAAHLNIQCLPMTNHDNRCLFFRISHHTRNLDFAVSLGASDLALSILANKLSTGVYRS